MPSISKNKGLTLGYGAIPNKVSAISPDHHAESPSLGLTSEVRLSVPEFLEPIHYLQRSST